LRPRRGHTPTGGRLPHAGKRWEEPQTNDYERREDHPDASHEHVWAEDDVSLRPLARALLALAEQLSQEEGP